MRLGTTLPHMGEGARPDVVVAAAQRAEALGYDTVWVADRLLYPLQPRTPYPSTPDGSLPEFYKIVLDPLATLTYVAARTERLREFESIINLQTAQALGLTIPPHVLLQATEIIQ